MRSSVLRILPPTRQNVIAIFYVFILIFLPSGARVSNAQKISFGALSPQAQGRVAPTPAPSTPQKKKGLSPLRNDEAAEGSRVTITYNEPLNDYSAYRRGNQFVIVIPKADAPHIGSGLRGRGFEGVQVEKRGDDTILSFRIRPGVKARVAQQFNRLEVIFSPPGQSEAKAATVTQPGAAVSSSTSPGKASQGTQTSGDVPETMLANHNTTGAQADQTKDGSASVDSSAEPAVALTQPNAAAPVDASLSPSTKVSTTASQPPADKTGTGQASPVSSPRTGFAAVRMLMTRHWLPVLIAALLLLSAYMVIAARRRTERNSSSSGGRIPVAHDGVLEGVEEETQALRIKNPVETASLVAETASAHAEVIEIAAETHVIQQDAGEDTTTGASVLNEACKVSAEHHENIESRESESAILEDEAPGVEVEEEPEFEVIEGAAAQSNPIVIQGAEAAQMGLIEEPAAVENDASRAPGAVLDGVSNRMASEWAAAMMDLPAPGSEDAFGTISAAFDHPSQPVRNAAARALFDFSPDRVASFKRIMQESSTERRRRIGAAIASSGMALEAINDLTSRSGAKAYEALLVLSLMAKAGEVKSLILAIEEHPSTEVRLALVKLLALSGQQEALTGFRHLAARDSLPIAVRSSIMEALHQINDPGSFDLSST